MFLLNLLKQKRLSVDSKLIDFEIKNGKIFMRILFNPLIKSSGKKKFFNILLIFPEIYSLIEKNLVVKKKIKVFQVLKFHQ
jgi:hypothetical protein